MSYATRVAKLEAAENQQLCCYLWVDARTDDIEAEQAKRIAEVRAANNVPDAYPVMLTVVSWLPAQEDAHALPIEG